MNADPALDDQAGARHAIDLAHGRFYPIFAFLFGVGVSLFLAAATCDGRNPTVLLLRRLARCSRSAWCTSSSGPVVVTAEDGAGWLAFLRGLVARVKGVITRLRGRDLG